MPNPDERLEGLEFAGDEGGRDSDVDHAKHDDAAEAGSAVPGVLARRTVVTLELACSATQCRSSREGDGHGLRFSKMVESQWARRCPGDPVSPGWIANGTRARWLHGRLDDGAADRGSRPGEVAQHEWRQPGSLDGRPGNCRDVADGRSLAADSISLRATRPNRRQALSDRLGQWVGCRPDSETLRRHLVDC